MVPSPRQDKHLIGEKVSLRAIPIFPLLEGERVRGPTRYWTEDLSSAAPQNAPASVVFHYDRYEETTGAESGDSGGPSILGASPDGDDDMMSALTKFLREAITQVPSVRYAFGAAGIAAAGALITLFLGYGRPAIVVWAGTLVAMILLLLFASAATAGARTLRGPAMLLVHAVTVFFCLFLALTVTAFVFSWPPNWASFLGIDLSSDVRGFSVLGDTVNFGCERGAVSNASYHAPPGFRILNAHAETHDFVGAKNASAAVVSQSEHSVSAKADFFGRDLEWTHNCPGGGHGRVRLWGEYVRENPPWFVAAAGAAVFSLAALAAAFALVPNRRRGSATS